MIRYRAWWDPRVVVSYRLAFPAITWRRIYEEDSTWEHEDQTTELTAACYELAGPEDDIIELVTLSSRKSRDYVRREIEDQKTIWGTP